MGRWHIRVILLVAIASLGCGRETGPEERILSPLELMQEDFDKLIGNKTEMIAKLAYALVDETKLGKGTNELDQFRNNSPFFTMVVETDFTLAPYRGELTFTVKGTDANGNWEVCAYWGFRLAWEHREGQWIYRDGDSYRIHTEVTDYGDRQRTLKKPDPVLKEYNELVTDEILDIRIDTVSSPAIL